MGYEMTGTVKVIMEPMTFPSGFAKREFVITVEDGKFPQDISFECVKERMNLIDGLTVGSVVTVAFDIRGREHNGRYFNNLNAWKITQGGGASPQHQQQPQAGGRYTSDGPPMPDDSQNPALEQGGGNFDDPF